MFSFQAEVSKEKGEVKIEKYPGRWISKAAQKSFIFLSNEHEMAKHVGAGES